MVGRNIAAGVIGDAGAGDVGILIEAIRRIVIDAVRARNPVKHDIGDDLRGGLARRRVGEVLGKASVFTVEGDRNL